jgi:hypothetical protein
MRSWAEFQIQCIMSSWTPRLHLVQWVSLSSLLRCVTDAFPSAELPARPTFHRHSIWCTIHGLNFSFCFESSVFYSKIEQCYSFWRPTKGVSQGGLKLFKLLTFPALDADDHYGADILGLQWDSNILAIGEFFFASKFKFYCKIWKNYSERVKTVGTATGEFWIGGSLPAYFTWSHSNLYAVGPNHFLMEFPVPVAANTLCPPPPF